jgi:hypothetical protein
MRRGQFLALARKRSKDAVERAYCEHEATADLTKPVSIGNCHVVQLKIISQGTAQSHCWFGAKECEGRHWWCEQ